MRELFQPDVLHRKYHKDLPHQSNYFSVLSQFDNLLISCTHLSDHKFILLFMFAISIHFQMSCLPSPFDISVPRLKFMYTDEEGRKWPFCLEKGGSCTSTLHSIESKIVLMLRKPVSTAGASSRKGCLCLCFPRQQH